MSSAVTIPQPAATGAAAQAGAAANAAAAAVATSPSSAAAAAAAAAAQAQAQAAALGQPGAFTSGSLYVGDLHPDVAEAALFEIFNRVGPVASIRVCRDAITRRSLGYAYVNYHSAVDAVRAAETLNTTPIKGRPCRIMWSQRDPTTRKSGKGNIFIKNLAKEIDQRQLMETFQQFGTVLSCKIEYDLNGVSKGYGYIQYAEQESADKAVATLNDKLLNEKKIFVGPFVPRKERSTPGLAQSFTNVYIKNLTDKMTDARLLELFGAFGPIKSAVVMKGNEDSEHKGFGFVNFEHPEDAASAVEGLNNEEIDGKTVYVGRAQKKSERESELRQRFEAMKLEQMSKYQGVNLYVKNLDDDINDDKLRQIFAPYGNITSAKVMADPNRNSSRGFGFVCYSTPEEATKAVNELHGKIVGTKPLYVAMAQRREIRKAQLEAQFAQRKAVPSRIPAPMFNGNAGPIFFPPGGQQVGVGGFVYPPQLIQPRGGRFQPVAAYPMNNYMLMNGQMVPGVAQQGQGNPRGPKQAGRGGQGQGQGPVMMRRAGGPKPGMQFAGMPGMPMDQAMQVQQQQAQQQQQPTQIEVLASVLANYPPEEQKVLLGDKLYPLIVKSQPELAGKITGMILDSCSSDEILQFIEKPDALNEKVEEALQALREHQESQANQQ